MLLLPVTVIVDHGGKECLSEVEKSFNKAPARYINSVPDKNKKTCDSRFIEKMGKKKDLKRFPLFPFSIYFIYYGDFFLY